MKDAWALNSTNLTPAEPNTRRNAHRARLAYAIATDLRVPERLQRKPWQSFWRVHLFRVTIGFSEQLDLLHHVIGVNWPEAAALLDKLIDDSLELLFLNVIEHKIVKGRA